ncbi:uncharacterized protein LOC107491989 isoform X2 [Arachis duranensis]|uniref:Uncharacterized protein LOC107476792 isoform X2 n=1 Tax=Arachis duranensis TaxID=130453 RepID=A0A9C6TRI3_ARADU|nr:uncharacterized protein LOC107496883 isoform X2 [Arachis duranensis]XP_052114630.1 uncharacterized protein LOC107476792 isoform X2 [Arachis duranensis]XP_052118777.1 uncharacterized protein LOC107491989 isoform X2 [Arachis duranensis]
MMKGLLWLNVVEKYLLLTWTTVEKFFRVANGEGLPLAVKELGICDLYPQVNFIEDEGPILVKGGKEIIPNVIKTVQVARQRGILIVWWLNIIREDQEEAA